MLSTRPFTSSVRRSKAAPSTSRAKNAGCSWSGKSSGSGDAPELGLPVDRVLGLVDAEAPATREPAMVAGHLPVEGRVTGVLDARLLVARAAETISGSGRTGFHNPEHGGET